MKNFLLLFIFIICHGVTGFSQVVWTYPLFPTQNDNITLYYNASEGNAALKNYNGNVYAHTGVTTSPGSTTWQYVQGTWGTDDAKVKMMETSPDIWKLSYNITSFYNFPANATVDRLAFVFRNQDGSVVGRNSDGSDIFYQIWDGVSFQSKFLSPFSFTNFVNLNDQVNIVFVTSKNANITLYKNNIFVAQFDNTDSINYTITASDYGNTWIKTVCDDGTSLYSDSTYFVVNKPVVIADLPANTKDGINYINDTTVTLVLTAPDKSFVYAIGDFSNWQVEEKNYFNKTPDGKRWWATITGLLPAKEYAYQYLIDKTIYVADPFCDKVLDPWNDKYIPASTYPNLLAYPSGKANGIVSVMQTLQTPYVWQTNNFVKPPSDNMVVYELLVRDFVGARNYQTLIDTINYLKTLGITAIELMPFNEFEGNDSWGYNPDYYFAPDKYYGTKDKLKEFIDVCHANGLMVIQDMVLNHSFSLSPMCQMYWDAVTGGPSTNNPWYNADCDLSTPGYQGKHPYGVGYDFNHESEYTKEFVDAVLKYWVTEYRIDGFRFDLSKGFTQKYTGNDVGAWGVYDQSRIDLLKRMADEVWKVDPSVILILEHFADNSEEKVLSAHGFYLWGNIAYGYKQSAMGYVSGADIGWINYLFRNWTAPHVVGYMESHDEERIMYNLKNFGNHNATYDVRPLDSALSRAKLAALFFIPIPGPKMIWQFGELGYDYSINYNGGNTASKPIKWDYLQYGPRKWLYNFYTALNILKRDYSIFRTTNFSMSVSGLKKNLRLNSDTLNINILGNFEIISSNIAPAFQHTGWWFEYFTGDSVYITDVNANINLKPGEYKMYFDKKQELPDLGNVGVEEVNANNSLKLFQNFPNPARIITTIDLYVPQYGRVLLQVFDINGRLIETITDGSFAAGYYTVDFHVGKLSNGTYLIKLTSEMSEQTIKMEVSR